MSTKLKNFLLKNSSTITCILIEAIICCILGILKVAEIGIFANISWWWVASPLLILPALCALYTLCNILGLLLIIFVNCICTIFE